MNKDSSGWISTTELENYASVLAWDDATSSPKIVFFYNGFVYGDGPGEASQGWYEGQRVELGEFPKGKRITFLWFQIIYEPDALQMPVEGWVPKFDPHAVEDEKAIFVDAVLAKVEES